MTQKYISCLLSALMVISASAMELEIAKGGTGTYQYGEGSAGQYAEVVSCQRQSHRQHDNAEDDRLRGAANPHEEVGYEECYHGDGNDKQ